MTRRALAFPALAALLVACAGQDEELVIPTAPECPETSTCGATDGSAGGGGDAGGGDASLGCSKESVTAAGFSVKNTTGVLDLDVYWVDFACAEQLFGTVTPQATLPGQSYVTHVWRVRNKANGLLFREFVIQPGANAVSVP